MADRPDPRDGLIARPGGLAHTFNQIPHEYDARPAYPGEVFDLLVARTGLGPGTHVLEIGPGTGHATIPLLALGARVTAVEPGPQLAARLQDRTAGDDVEVIVSTFEEASLPEASFDVIAAATAYHWVDATVGANKCAHTLRDGGWVALWWTIWGDPRRADPFHDALKPILRAKAPHLIEEVTSPEAYERDIAARVAHIEATGAFDPASHTAIEWSATHDPIALRRLFGTFGPWLALPESLRTELLTDVEELARGDFSGSVTRPYRTILYFAQHLVR